MDLTFLVFLFALAHNIWKDGDVRLVLLLGLVVLRDGTQKREDLSLLVWINLLGAGLEKMESLSSFFYTNDNIRNKEKE